VDVGAGSPGWQLRIGPRGLVAATGGVVGAVAESRKQPGKTSNADGRPTLVRGKPWWHPYETEADFWAAADALPASCRAKLDSMPIDKKARYLQFTGRCSSTKEIYGNCELLAPDGTLMAKCDEKKVKWYLSKELARQICDDPIRIQLLFEPEWKTKYANMTEEERETQKSVDAFYVQEKRNQCVVCGALDKYLRFHIVPTLYRRLLPEAFKSHSSHDVVLLCVACHEKANTAHWKRKLEFAAQYDAPLMQSEVRPFGAEANARKAALALSRSAAAMPPDRRQFMCDQVLAWDPPADAPRAEGKVKFSVPPADLGIPEDLFRAALAPLRDVRHDHGEVVVGAVTDVPEFIQGWREHFVTTMDPKFLPPMWGVNSKAARLFGSHSRFGKSEAG